MAKWKNYLKDNIIGTVFIFVLLAGIFWVSQRPFLDAMDPIGAAISDMELTDLVFNNLRDDPEIDTNIVVVNIGLIPRGMIGMQLDIINKYEPAVVGFDFDFLYENTEDPEGDSILAQAIANTENLVIMCKLMQTDSLQEANPGADIYDTVSYTIPKLSQNAIFGFANLQTEAVKQEDFKACRLFPPQREVKGKTINAFALEMAKQFDEKAANEFIKREKDWEVINYSGNVVDFYATTNYPTSYFALDWMQVLNEDFDESLIKDKIVIFGYLGKNFGDTSWDDKFFTPLNKNFAGKTNPDMYGVVIHANIVSMILRGDYINTLGEGANYLIGILVCFLNVMFFSWIYRRLPRWYDGLTKLIQIFELMIMLFIVVMVFHFFSLKLEITIAFAVTAVVGDGLEVYFGVFKNLFRKETRKQLFTINRD